MVPCLPKTPQYTSLFLNLLQKSRLSGIVFGVFACQNCKNQSLNNLLSPLIKNIFKMDGNKMIKISTPAQFAKLVEIMKRKPHLAKGYHKSLAKIDVKKEWNQISEDINSLGTPSRSGEAWMKVWADFKCKLKKNCHITKQRVMQRVEDVSNSLFCHRLKRLW